MHETAVFVALCHFQNLEGGCFPSVQRLSEVSKVGRTSVFKALEGLEEKGAIAREERRHGGQKTSNYYTVHQVRHANEGKNQVRHVNEAESQVHHANEAKFATRTVDVRHTNGNYIQEQEQEQEPKENTKTCSGGSFLQPIENHARERKVTPLKELEKWIEKMAEK